MDKTGVRKLRTCCTHFAQAFDGLCKVCADLLGSHPRGSPVGRVPDLGTDILTRLRSHRCWQGLLPAEMLSHL